MDGARVAVDYIVRDKSKEGEEQSQSKEESTNTNLQLHLYTEYKKYCTTYWTRKEPQSTKHHPYYTPFSLLTPSRTVYINHYTQGR